MASPSEIAAWSAALPDVGITGLLFTSLQLPNESFASTVMVDRPFFAIFGVKVLMGGFREEHYLPNQPVTPVIISHRLWRDAFDQNPAVLGTVVRPPGAFSQPWEIVGVLAPGEIVPPLLGQTTVAPRRQNRIDALRPSTGEAHSERSSMAFARVPAAQKTVIVERLRSVVRTLRESAPAVSPQLTPEQRRRRAPFDDVRLVPIGQYLSARERPALLLTFGAVMTLVALVFLNVASLAASRAHQRLRELSLRRAIGARTGHLLRHAFAEQAIIAIIGGVAGVVLARVLLAVVIDLLPPGLNLIKEPQLDWRVSLFALAIAAGGASAVSVLSVLVTSRRSALVPSTARLDGTPGPRRVTRVLIVGQTAIAFCLALAGALLVTSLARVWNEDVGFEYRDAAIVTTLYNDRNLSAYRTRAAELATRLRGTPGIIGVAAVDGSLLQNAANEFVFQPPTNAPAGRPASMSVSSGFFETAMVRLVDGRFPSTGELETGAPVIVITESLAQSYWPGQAAIGRTLRAGRVDCTVVGVIADMRLVALDVPSAGVILAPWTLAIPRYGAPSLLVRLDDSLTLDGLVERMRQMDANVRLTNVQSLEDAASTSVRDRRLSAVTAVTFGAASLVFVAVGVLGLVAMTASRRTREVGIRLALGATPPAVVRLLVNEQLGAALIGLVIGGGLAALGAPLLRAYLYGVGAYDLRVWSVTALLILFVTVLGAFVPARRAGRLDPSVALRQS
jgi:putative ABC transport system permease protein